MKVWGLTEGEIRKAVSEAGLSVHNDWSGRGITESGNALLVRLSVDRTQPRNEAGLLPFQTLSRQGRRLPSVTWEGHREFMRIVFRDHPEARIKSAIADYRGRDDFWQKHPSTRGMWNHTAYHGFR